MLKIQISELLERPVDEETLIFTESQLINVEDRIRNLTFCNSNTIGRNENGISKQVGEKDDRKMCHLHMTKLSPYKVTDRCKREDAAFNGEVW